MENDAPRSWLLGPAVFSEVSRCAYSGMCRRAHGTQGTAECLGRLDDTEGTLKAEVVDSHFTDLMFMNLQAC